MSVKEFEPFVDIPKSELMEYIADLTSEPGVVVVRMFEQPGTNLWTVIAGRTIADSATNEVTAATPSVISKPVSDVVNTAAVGSKTDLFVQLVDAYVKSDIAPPALKTASLAQWILESGRGASDLAKNHLNFAGLKFRDRMTGSHGFNPPAIAVDYPASDGVATYCKFQSVDHFIAGYWHFIKSGPYTDWDAFSNDALGYIGYLKQKNYAGDPLYVTKVTKLFEEAKGLLESSASRLGVALTTDSLSFPSQPTSIEQVVPDSWMPNCQMARVICHWTAGRHQASKSDKYHYHILIESDGKLVRGTHTIRDNVSTADHKYAAHTKGTNTGSIGVSVCCMNGAKEKPFKAGKYPMTKKQWDVMIAVVADLCRRYNIAPLEHTVLGHGEVQKNIGNPQNGKWDPMKMPWEPNLSFGDVGRLLRNGVSALL